MRGPLPTLLCVAVLFLAGWHLAAAAAEQLVFADSFEAEETGWRGSGEFRPSDEHAAPGKGKRSLLILRGSCETAPIPVEPESRYLVRLNSFSEHPGSFTLQAIELDRDGKALTPDFANRTSEILWGRSTGKERERKFWLPVALYFDTGKEAAAVRLLIRKSGGPERRLWIDDVRIEKVTSDRPCPVPDPEVPGELSRDALMVLGPTVISTPISPAPVWPNPGNRRNGSSGSKRSARSRMTAATTPTRSPRPSTRPHGRGAAKSVSARGATG